MYDTYTIFLTVENKRKQILFLQLRKLQTCVLQDPRLSLTAAQDTSWDFRQHKVMSPDNEPTVLISTVLVMSLFSADPSTRQHLIQLQGVVGVGRLAIRTFSYSAFLATCVPRGGYKRSPSSFLHNNTSFVIPWRGLEAIGRHRLKVTLLETLPPSTHAHLVITGDTDEYVTFVLLLDTLRNVTFVVVAWPSFKHLLKTVP